MATATGKVLCVICEKEKITFKCEGCSKEYCFNHLKDHKQELNKQLDEIEVTRDIFRQSFTEHTEETNTQILIKQIDEWEPNSITKIQQTAKETREILIKNTNESYHQIEIKLNKLTNELRETRQENDFDELNLRQFEEELKQLTKQLTKLPNISIREDSTTFISKISVNVSDSPATKSTIHQNTIWMQNGITVAGGNGKGNRLDQLNRPNGIYIDEDQIIYVADFENDRIMEWECGATKGQVAAGGNRRGNQTNQLNHPTDVIVDEARNSLIICDRDKRRIIRWRRRNGTSTETIIFNIDCGRLTTDNNGYLYISDMEKHEVRRWKEYDSCRTLVAGGNGRGNRLDQLNCPTYIFVYEDHSIYVSDRENDRVMKWIQGAKEGIVVAGGQGQGNSLAQLTQPQGLIFDHLGAVFVADTRNHRIMRWPKGATQGNIVVGGNGQGEQANQFNRPVGLSFDREGNLYVADHLNHRVQRFNIDRS